MIADEKLFKQIDGTEGDKIVLLKWGGAPPKFRNLIRINSAGEEVWTVTPAHPLEGVYTALKYDGSTLTAYNISGYLEVINYATGHVVSRKFVK